MNRYKSIILSLTSFAILMTLNCDKNYKISIYENDEKLPILLPISINSKMGYIDIEGNIVIDPVFDEAYEFHEGLARVKINNLFGFINRKGIVIIKPKYISVGKFSEGLASVGINDDDSIRYAFISIDDDIVLDNYDKIMSGFKDGIAIVARRNKYKFIDKNGNRLFNRDFEAAWRFSDDLACVKIGNKYGYIDKNGIIKIEPKYEYADLFSCGRAYVSINGKRGYINVNGTMIIGENLEGDSYGRFENGLAMFVKNEYFGFIDTEGNEVIKPSFIAVSDFSEELAMFVDEYDKRGFINKSGEIVIKPKYTYAYDFSRGYAKVSVGEKWIYIKKDGSEIWPKEIK